MIELNDLTIIIPVKIESIDRYNNLKTVLGYINHHFKTNVKIIEESSDKSKIDFLDDFKNLTIDYKFYCVPESVPYHRTKYLNEMIFSTKTKVVSNYDSDVFFPVETYVNVVNSILNNESDFIYPYLRGDGQKKLFYSNWQESSFKEWVYYPMIQFLKNFDISVFNDDDENIKIDITDVGHSLFANTDKYKEAFAENEDFISYGPEDKERAHRFETLGYRINWYHDYVYHIEHSRTNDSNKHNPNFEKNCEIYDYIKDLSKDELYNYYKEKDYLKKYKKQ